MRIGSLFSGYGGLTLGIQQAIGGTVAWHSEIEGLPTKKRPTMAGPARILANRFPGVPNLGDITKVNWCDVEPVDVIEGGSPCQDLSHAGKRAGMKVGTRSGLWASMCDAIDIIRPRLVVWENVRGALSAAADSAVEPCPICLGDGREVTLRALGRVLGDLAELGYDARWVGIRASDIGAPHGRFRVFVVAWPAADADRQRHGRGQDGRGVGPVDGAHEGKARQRERARAESGDRGAEAPTNAQGDEQRESADRFGPYASAVARWAAALGRPAPDPTEPGRTGRRLSPRFVEWMMGLPDGWVTDVPGISRADQLKALGNGVVPQQAAAAVRIALGDSLERAA